MEMPIPIHSQATRLRRSYAFVVVGAAVLVNLCVLGMQALYPVAARQLIAPQPPWEGGVMLGAAMVAGMLASALLWWLVVVRPRDPSLTRGAVAGALSGLVVHPLTWYLGFLTLALVYGVQSGDLGRAALTGLLYGFPISFIYTGLGLAAGGWLTIIVGALGGGLLGYLLSRQTI